MDTFKQYAETTHTCPNCGGETTGLYKGFFVHCKTCVQKYLREIKPTNCLACGKKTYGALCESQEGIYIIKRYCDMCLDCAQKHYRVIVPCPQFNYEQYMFYARTNQVLYTTLLNS